MINLYIARETNFNHNEFVLDEAIKCEVTEELNGTFELDLEYPVKDTKGISSNITRGALIKCPVGDKRQPQLFRIRKVTKTTKRITAYAESIPISDLRQNFIRDTNIVGKNRKDAIKQLLDRSQQVHNFTVGALDTNNTLDILRIVRYSTLRALVGTDSNTVINRYGGEIIYNNFELNIVDRRGKDNGVLIAYGKNITGIEETIDDTELATCIIPQGKDELLLPEYQIDSPYINNYEKIHFKKIDFNNIGIVEPTNDEPGVTREEALQKLRDAVEYMYSTDRIDIPSFNYKVNFMQLSKTEEYKDYAILEDVELGDTVTIQHLKMNINLDGRIIKTKYNVLLDRFTEIELGFKRKTITDIIDETNKQIEYTKQSIELGISNLDATLNATIKITEGAINANVNDKVAGLESDINMTAKGLETKITDSANGLTNNMNITAKGLEAKIVDSASTLTNDMNITARGLEGKITDATNELTNNLNVTASGLDTKLTNSISKLTNDLAITASGLEGKITDSVTGLTNNISATAKGLDAKITDTASGFASDLALTASGLETKIANTSSGMTNDLALTASGLEAKIANSATSLTNSFNLTASGLETKIADTATSLTNNLSVTAKGLETKITDTSAKLTNSLNITASGLETKISDSATKLTNSFNITTSGLDAKITDTSNTLSNSITATASGLTTSISNTRSELLNNISVTAAGLDLKLTDTKTGLTNTINTNQSGLLTKIADTKAELQNDIKVSASGLDAKISSQNTTLTNTINATSASIDIKIADTKTGLQNSINATSSSLSASITSGDNALRTLISAQPGQIMSQVSGEITNQVNSKTQTMKNDISQLTSDMSTNATKIQQLSSSISSVVKTGDMASLIQQNSTAVKVAFNNINDNFQITSSGASFGNVSYGEYTKLTSKGLEHYSNGSSKPYKYLCYVGSVSISCSGSGYTSKTVSIPSYFSGSSPQVICSIKKIYDSSSGRRCAAYWSGAYASMSNDTTVRIEAMSAFRDWSTGDVWTDGRIDVSYMVIG